MGGLGREESALASSLSALEPPATSKLLKAPGALPLAAGAQASAGASGKKTRPSIRALKPDVPPPFTPVPGVPAGLATNGTPGAASDLEGDDVVRVPGVIPQNVLPLQSETATIPRYSAALERLLAARGERTTARLAFKSLGDAGATELASILSTGTCKNLEGLDASCNEFGAIGASALAVSAKGRPMPFLRALPILTACKLNQVALRKNHVLSTLDISTNAIGDQGAAALADALHYNSALTYLDVHACGIHDSGKLQVTRAIM